MNLEINIPTKVVVLDDDKDALYLLKLMLNEAGIRNVYDFSTVQEMKRCVTTSSDVYLIDYHLPNINGGEVANIVKEISPESEFVFTSALLTADEYENLINTCGCCAIARKEDYQKVVFLVKRAMGNIQKQIIKAMEIVINGKALLEKIDNC